MKGFALANIVLIFLVTAAGLLSFLSVKESAVQPACSHINPCSMLTDAEPDRSLLSEIASADLREIFSSAAFAQQIPPGNAGSDVYNRLVDREMRRNMEVQNRTQTDVERSWAGGWCNQPFSSCPYSPYSPWSPFTGYPPSPCCPYNGK